MHKCRWRVSLSDWGGSCGLDIATLAAAGRTQKRSPRPLLYTSCSAIHQGQRWVSTHSLAHNNSRTDASHSLARFLSDACAQRGIIDLPRRGLDVAPTFLPLPLAPMPGEWQKDQKRPRRRTHPAGGQTDWVLCSLSELPKFPPRWKLKRERDDKKAVVNFIWLRNEKLALRRGKQWS